MKGLDKLFIHLLAVFILGIDHMVEDVGDIVKQFTGGGHGTEPVILYG